MNQSRSWAKLRGSRSNCARSIGSNRRNPGVFRRRDDLGQPGDGASLEERFQRHVDVEPAANLRHHLGRKQRMAAQFKEVVVATHALDVQELLPDRGERRLGCSLRRLVRLCSYRLALPALGAPCDPLSGSA